MKGLNELFVIAWLLFGIYMLVLILIAADLWSGVRKAKIRGEVRSSYGFKKTVDKIARYYNALLALTVVDCMQMGGVWYLQNFYESRIPLFPIITLIGAIGFGLIEIRSIFEKAEDKVKNDYFQVAALVSEIVKNKNEPAEIAQAVIDYMNTEKEKEKDK